VPFVKFIIIFILLTSNTIVASILTCIDFNLWWFNIVTFLCWIVVALWIFYGRTLKYLLFGIKEVEHTKRKLLESYLETSATKLGIKVPRLYIVDEDKLATAEAFGLKCYIFVDTAIFEDFNDNEVLAIIGHEMGHIKRRDSLSRLIYGLLTILLCLALLSISVSTIFITWFIVVGFLVFDNVYNRWTEYNADKIAAEVAGVKNIKAVLAKFEDIEENKIMSFLCRSHPSSTKRIKSLDE